MVFTDTVYSVWKDIKDGKKLQVSELTWIRSQWANYRCENALSQVSQGLFYPLQTPEFLLLVKQPCACKDDTLTHLLPASFPLHTRPDALTFLPAHLHQQLHPDGRPERQNKHTSEQIHCKLLKREGWCCRSRLLGHSWWDVGVAAVTWQVRSAPPAACLRGSEPPERWWLSPSLRPRLCGWTRTPDWWWSLWERCRVRWNPDKHQQRCASAPLNLNLKPPHVSSETCSAYRKDQALKRCSVKAIKSALDDFQTSDSYSDRSV